MLVYSFIHTNFYHSFLLPRYQGTLILQKIPTRCFSETIFVLCYVTMSIYRGKNRRELYLSSLLYDSIDDNNVCAIQSLCRKGADPNVILPRKGISPFHLAVGCDSDEFSARVTRLILQHGGNPNIRSDDGLTPVHIAAAWGRLEVLRLLLYCGGDPEARDINHFTPIYYARKEDFRECLELLESYLPENSRLLKRDSNAGKCNVKLDKIIVNNGHTIGEYGVLNPDEASISEETNLQKLPESDPNEYVLNWFRNHVDESATKKYPELPRSAGTTSDENFVSFESSMDESDNKNIKDLDVQNVTFRKMYRKKRKVRKDLQTQSKVQECSPLIPEEAKRRLTFTPPSGENENVSAPQLEVVSNESGIAVSARESDDVVYFVPKGITAMGVTGRFTYSDSIPASRNVAIWDADSAASDYVTCSDRSVDVMNKSFRLFGDDSLMTSDASSVAAASGGGELSFVSVSEVYKYEDIERGVVLFERRVMKAPSECNGSIKAGSLASKMSSIPEGFDYDIESLRKELTSRGYVPGPITFSTKRVYLRKLYQLKKYPNLAIDNQQQITSKRTYSPELQATLRDPAWTTDLERHRALEAAVAAQFCVADPARKWREGSAKSSFTYLLLDPAKTANLPCRADAMPPSAVWAAFLSAVFYVGKGKRSRPFSHLYEAVGAWKSGGDVLAGGSRKLRTILEVWRAGGGVVCLHVFQNIIPVEAYTREAAMLSALTTDSVCNVRQGEFYGVAATWPLKQKRMWGSYLLYKAMMIFLHEGERQLYPTDID